MGLFGNSSAASTGITNAHTKASTIPINANGFTTSGSMQPLLRRGGNKVAGRILIHELMVAAPLGHAFVSGRSAQQSDLVISAGDELNGQRQIQSLRQPTHHRNGRMTGEIKGTAAL